MRSLSDTAILTAFADAPIQSIYIERIWHLSNKNYVLTGILTLFALSQFTSTIIYYAQIYHLTEWIQLRRVLTTGKTMFSIVAVSDTAIAAVLVLHLHRRRSGFRNTDSVLNRLIMYTISTGMITGGFAIFGLVTAIALPDTFIYLLVDLVISKLHLNCVLASLNSREKLRNDLMDDSERGISIHLDNFHASTSPRERIAVADINSHDTSSPRTVEIKTAMDTMHNYERQKARSFARPISSHTSEIEAAVSTA